MLRIGNSTFNVEELKKITLKQAKELPIPHIEEAWRKVNKKPQKKS